MNQQDFLNLLRFYSACIEAEDQRSLTKKISALHRSLISPWDVEEPLFHPEAVEVIFHVDDKKDRKILLGGTALAGGPERFFYGYPIFLDEEGFLSPFFVTAVEIDHRGENRFTMRPVDPGVIQLNYHMFRRQHVQLEELRAIQEELEGQFGSFSDRLRAAFEALGVTPPNLTPKPLEPYPKSESLRNRWINRPILFKSERNIYTRHLQYELEALTKYPRLFNAIGTTAAGVVVGIGALPSSKATRHSPSPPLLQVLPLNNDQENAARAGLEAPLTVVTGPPGTGKSQVVVDILASCAAAGHPVLFASKNNKAVDVVRERIRTILGKSYDWTLRFGSRHVMDQSQEEMDMRLDSLRPETVPPRPAPRLLHQLEEEIAAVRRSIENLEQARNRYVALDRDRRVAEKMVNPSWVELWPSGVSPPDLSHIEQLMATAEKLAGKRPAGFWLKVKRALIPNLLKRRLRTEIMSIASALPSQIRADVEAVVGRTEVVRFSSLAEACGMLARLTRWRTAEEACREALLAFNAETPASILASHLERLQRQRAELACDQLRSIWTERLASRAASIRHALDSYFCLASRLRQSGGNVFFKILEQFKQSVQSIRADFPVWIVTNLSVRNALPLEPALFDLVVIDEASQCDIPSALPLLFRARRALIIGDPRQLRHISTLSSSEEMSLATQYGVENLLATWSYNQRSLYALAEGVALGRGEQPFFLAEHYRSHPEILEFSNRNFYQGQLILRTSIDNLHERLKGEPLGLFWHDVRGTVPYSSRSAINEIELRAVLRLLNEWANKGLLFLEDVSFGIVTPFRLQMERFEEAVRAQPWWEKVSGRLTVGTAHRFQGDERDVMIFSPVVANGMSSRLVRWVADTDQLLNVSITRARAALHVVGDLQACLAAGGFLGNFASTAREDMGSRDVRLTAESPAEMRMGELLTEVGLWFTAQYSIGRYRLDFLVVTPFGTRYNIEVDGRGHLTDEATRYDEVRDKTLAAKGLKILRVDARQLFNNEDDIRQVLQRLV